MSRKIIFNEDPSGAKENPKDFQELLKSYEKMTGGNASGAGKLKAIAFSALGVAACLLAVFFWSSSDDSALTAKDETPSPITTTVQEDNFHSAENTWTKTISSSEAIQLVSPTGVIIDIPENAFQASTDSVILQLTSLDKVMDVVKSRVPMHYDSAGVTYHFQSDGMFQLMASSTNEERATLNKEIDIHYPQLNGNVSASTYLLEENEWTYKETAPLTSYKEVCENTIYRFNQDEAASVNNSSAELAELNEQTARVEAELLKLERSKPLEPRKENLNNYRFQLDIDPYEFPELAQFEEVTFEVKDSRFNFTMYDQVWNDVSLEKSPKEGRYLVTLKSKKTVKIFDVYPVLEESEFEAAFAEYSEDMKQIEEDKKSNRSKLQRLEEQKRKFEEQQRAFEESLAVQRKKELKSQKRKRIINELLADLSEDTPYRSITLGGLGIVNFNTPIPLPAKGMNVPAEFIIADSNEPVHQVMVIDLKDNIYYTFLKPEFPEFRLMKGKKHLITTVTSDGEVATLSYDENLNLQKGELFVFELELVRDEVLGV